MQAVVMVPDVVIVLDEVRERNTFTGDAGSDGSAAQAAKDWE
jgi:hypothetical protein